MFQNDRLAILEATVLPYSLQTLEAAMHQEELPKSYFTFVTILAAQMGVGGDDSWVLQYSKNTVLKVKKMLNTLSKFVSVNQ
ncbi:MAG: hypothetical protein V8R63_08005 [Thomasclavelia ramosa]